MGCSPPASWYEQQNRITIEEKKRKHQQEIARFLNMLDRMSDEQREAVHKKLFPEEE